MKTIKKIYENKILRIILAIIRWVLTLIAVAMLLVIIVQRFSNNNITVAGYRIFNVATESMLPKYKVGDVLISKETEPNEIKVGDDLVYLGEKGDFAGKIVTHQVVDIDNKEGKYQFYTKGLSNELTDPVVNENQVYGIITYKTVLFSILGELMITPLGYFGLFAIASILLSYQLVRSFFYKDDEDEEE